ncbi:MAG: hypothetical protein ACMXYD_01740 [Candidatus Woesearchaeota archaeon]
MKQNINIIYRTNELLERFVPEIQNEFTKNNLPVSIHAFKKETGKEEIAKWYEENRSKLENQILITDNTTKPWINGVDIKRQPKGDIPLEELDSIITTAYTIALTSDNKQEREIRFDIQEESDQFYTDIFNQLQVRKPQEPIYIVQEQLADHMGSLNSLADTYLSERELEEKNKLENIMQEQYNGELRSVTEDIYYSEITPAARRINDIIASKHFKNLIERTERFTPIETTSEEHREQQPEGYVLIDRHNQYHQELPANNLLVLPESNLLEGLVKQKQLDINEKEVIHNLQKLVNEYFIQ